jgi:hypothetical protein
MNNRKNIDFTFHQQLTLFSRENLFAQSVSENIAGI